MNQHVKIGELASQFNVSTDTIRYYEKHGLLEPNNRSQAGYRLYDSHNQATLAFIIHAKSIGFTLKEIQYLVQIDENKAKYSCQTVKGFVDKKREKIQQQMQQLKHMERLLTKLSESCMGDDTSAQFCNILAGIETGIESTKGNAS